MNDEQKARVIANCETMAKALRDGLPLEFRNMQPFSDSKWDLELYASFDIGPHLEYRIKPEPRTIWVNEYADVIDGYTTEECARCCQETGANRIAVEYREVVK